MDATVGRGRDDAAAARAARRGAAGGLLRAGLLGGAIAAALNGALFAAATAAGLIVPIEVAPGRGPITLGAVVAVSLVSGPGAAGLLALLGRLVRRPAWPFVALATAVFALALLPVFAIPGVPRAMVATLLLMHAVAAASVCGALRARAARARGHGAR